MQNALQTMNQNAASESRVVLPRQIAQEPSISKVIEIHPSEQKVLAPRARIVIARNPTKQSSFHARRASCHFLLLKLLRSISATQRDCWELKHSDSGAPTLASGESQNLFISMARSGDWLAAGVSLYAGIGIDIECIKPRANISAKADFLNWKVPVVDIQDFYAKWTLWEASAKCVEGSVLMRKNPGFDKLCQIDTRNEVGRSGQWNGLHDCLNEKVFYAVVLQCEKTTDLSHQFLHPEKMQPWPVSNYHYPTKSLLS